MKELRRKIAKWFLIFTWPVLVIGIVALSVMFFIRNNEYQKLQNTYSQAQSQLNKDNEDKQLTIEDLQKDFTDLVEKVDNLESENSDLKAELAEQQAEGIGMISGRIFPFISESNGSFNQYQRVCAELTTNTNLQYCTTASALTQDYKLYLPQGEYMIYAEIFPTSNGSRAYYTQGIACALNTYGEESCDQDDAKPLAVAVITGQTQRNINPVAWSTAE